MADGFIEVTPSTDPTLKKVDNEVVNNDAAVSVFRQKVAVVNSDDGPLSTSLSGAVPAGTNNIGDVDVLTLPGGTVAGASSLPAGTNNIGDVDVLTLPALPAGTNNIGDVDVLTLPAIPAGTNNIGDVDVLTLPATPTGDNRIGRVKLTDDTDVATYLPVRTQPATTEVTTPTTDIPNRLPTYGVTIATQTPAITVGVKNLLDIWHPNTITQDAYIVEIWVTGIVTTASTAGRSTIRVSTITSAPTGGTNLTAADVGGAGASAFGTAGNLMQVKTGGGAIGTTLARKIVWTAAQPVNSRISESVFSASNPGNGIILRGGASTGICIDLEREVAHTALVDLWTVGIRWLEI